MVPHEPQPTTGHVSRRAALGSLAGTGLAAAFLATVGHAAARAPATPTPEVPPGYNPNGYSLDGPGTHISYGTTSLDGRPTLTYRGTYPEQTFRGEEIHLEGSRALVRMVSVLVEQVPDARVVYLTVLLPEFRPIRLGDPPIAFETVAILTTHPTSFAGPTPVAGARQTYEVVPLTGTASFAVS
ncbi:MAG TPA: hypothetical protein VH482_06640 [Thermomicrobiales bacterium]|jgi:hypothetical protein